ncbi:maleylpyruvate isomerase N-terminal domain-containing protein [Hymenobacter sp. ISL-91]|uniref:maleylpyruvate isomerase N-terminal domain-containing protein n=1 Tax=Hymenobacter sp. ISL-91 TaxID=2819151 RepID=UPI001BEA67A4|nr:maleylpyruvate isomerase N-terminal domain-containing protein [Hymenobacter sp. ISL-91]MBT2559008.1 maleylpyruvate isomerase N-terminal domain-containing protein [Hymenobacter sp. ISL-91]
MHSLPPVQTIDLFPVLDRHLFDLLASLAPADWERPTLAPQWKVRDVALHLLDGSLRALSMLRDGHFGVAPAGNSYSELVVFLDQLNADWVKAGQRLSPTVIRELLEQAGAEYNQYLASLDLWAPAIFAVGWAGETTSPNWFHIARDYTEKWHHQQQIRQAVGQEGALLVPALYQPFLDTCVRALPHHYRAVPASAGSVIAFTIVGPVGGTWYLQREEEAWVLGQGYVGPLAATVELDGAVAWRLFTKSLPRQQAQAHVAISGDERLGLPVFGLTTVMG